MSAVSVLTLSGSLRRGSLNTQLLGEADRIAPSGLIFDHFRDLGQIPPFNEDEEHPMSPAVADLRKRIRAADALLIATPEYNSSLPGMLKNALDWLSRPDGADAVLHRKPVAIIGASTGPFGTVRAQLALRQVLHKLDANVLGQPEFYLFHAHQQLAEDGTLPAGSPARTLLLTVLDGLISLVRQRQPQVIASATIGASA